MLYYLDLLPGSLLARMDSDNRDDKTTRRPSATFSLERLILSCNYIYFSTLANICPPSASASPIASPPLKPRLK